ncbi:DUF927 domain-containing protein [Meiothermus taiwanensis]|uniref:Bifunctional DNA primase/polymerase n=1 Tax=Meiothermus taiwanensis WR-220 TaxID=1339250 RepID=A0ABM6WFH5_9DEIN|nr:DUF927 domain-containing protein [Meiothermus taiwanensis]AWR85667.1 bifunctional DNA primase/polymerase [Meiothermus taiwanensis WR-220]
MRLASVPSSLRSLNQWVLWRFVERDGKRTKAPYQPSGKPARSNDPTTWTDFESAVKALKAGNFDGLGFVFAKDGGIVGVDLDWKAWAGEGVPLEAQTIVDRLNSYTEWSPSRKGCHVLLRGKLPDGIGNRKQLAPGVDLEVYDHGRFFTVTGWHWTGYPEDLEDRQAELEALLAEIFPRKQETLKGAPQPVALDDTALLERMFSSKHGAKIRRLWDGDTSGYPSQSEADLALTQHLMWWCGNDTGRVDRLFRQSGLYRPKWDEKRFSDGRTYGEGTLEKARASEAAEAPTCPLDGRTGGGLVLGEPRYKIERGQIWAAKPEKRGEQQRVGYYPLSNFCAVIEREIIATDGLEAETLFEVKGYTSTGRSQPVALVRAAEFSALNWVARHWGSEAVVLPGQSNRDHLRAAIQFLSLEGLRRATVYRHLGWAKVGEQWVYLHAGGGIGAEGSAEALEVAPGRVFEGFALPDPPEGEAEREAIPTLWGLREVAPSRVSVPLLLYALAAPLGHSPFSLYLAGPSGSQKTSLALVVQSLWGWHEAPPASWEGTANALEGYAFTAKDALLLVDDYAPQASEQKQKELQAKAARLLRSQGNATGRGRMRADGSLAGDRPPRGSLLVTGEDLPPGHSIRARCLFLELERGEVRLPLLTEAQTQAREGVYARALSGWVRWLARDLEAHRDRLRSQIEALRPRYSSSHARTTDALARLHAVWELYRAYAAAVGADQAALEGEVLEALGHVLQAQGEHQRGSDPVERFGGLLFSALRMGRGHLMPLNWRPGRDIEDYLSDPSHWGWRYRETTSGHPDAHGVWEPLGPQVGWLPDDFETHGLYLDPTPTYTVLARLANESGEPLPTERTLWKRLAERGAIHARVEAGVTRYQARVRVGGELARVIHLAGVYIAKSGNSGNNEHNTVQDGINPVPTNPGVPTQEWEQKPPSGAASEVFPLASGNSGKSGNSLNHVQDGTKHTVPTVPTPGDIRGSRATQAADEEEGGDWEVKLL